jgi:hypothetical protein
MEFTIVMDQTEFVISTIAGPLIATAYFSLKLYFNKRTK